MPKIKQGAWEKCSSDWVNTETGFEIACPPYNWMFICFPSDGGTRQRGMNRPMLRKEDGDPVPFYTLYEAMMVADLIAKQLPADKTEKSYWQSFNS